MNNIRKPQTSNAVLICNNDNVNEINERIFERNLAYGKADTPISFRSQDTRYRLFPIIDNDQCNNDDSLNLAFDTTTMFLPGNSRGPWSAYASKINNESLLKNQTRKLQKDDAMEFITRDDSQLYKYDLVNKRNHDLDKFPALFENPTFSNNDENYNNLKLNNSSNSIFNNHTRQQLKAN